MKKSTKSEKPAAPQAKPAAKKSAEPATVKKAAAPKKVATPKKSAASSMPAPMAATVPPAMVAPTLAAPVPTTIVAQIDIGFGNQLFVRGEGPGLSWDQGVLMKCVEDDRWTYTIEGATAPVVFKFLINDLSWSAGDDYRVAPGATVVLTPSF